MCWWGVHSIKHEERTFTAALPRYILNNKAAFSPPDEAFC